MKQRMPCYLRTHRRIWGLTQRELASLLGLTSGTQVSRLEKSKRTPVLRVAIACQVLFGIPPAVLFPHVYAEVEEQVMARIYRFYQGIEHSSTSAGQRKRELCEVALKRAVRSHH